MTRSTADGAEVVRPARAAGADDGDVAAYQPLTVDGTGALIVTGAGASPSATALMLQDGSTTAKATVTALGELMVLVANPTDVTGLATQATLASLVTRSLNLSGTYGYAA